jgi:site-specific DNA-adenine methylase
MSPHSVMGAEMIDPHAREDLRAPFPWFGGKSKVAPMVWQRFGDVQNYVEPFFGSGAVLLGRPSPAGIETVNDLDCMVANFWRALQQNPDAVAAAADWPVNEADQHARHLWLCSQEEFRERIKTDPEFYDTKIAGWWVWGQCIWIGSGWCARQLPHLGDAGRGVNRQRPHLGDAGMGVHRQLPHLGDAGMGVHRKRPHLGNAGDPCEVSDFTSGTREHLVGYMNGLAERLRRVRVCCGDWSRVCGPAPTVRLGITGVFLDPPYLDGRTDKLYASDSLTVANEVREWALAQGNDSRIRIALCGYEGEHDLPGWDCFSWKASGGYGIHRRARENSAKERIWFSPHCLSNKQLKMFA